MPWWLGLGGLLLSLFQGNQAASAQQKAIDAAKLSDEDIADLRAGGESSLKSNLASRGLLDSSLLSGGLGRLTRELADAKRRGSAQLSSIYQSQADKPSFLTQLVPLLLQMGLKGPGGQSWLDPYKPQFATAPASGPYPWNPSDPLTKRRF